MEGGNGERCVVCGDCGEASVARDHSERERDARRTARGDLARRGIAYIFLRLTGSAYHKHIEQTEPGNDEGPSPQLQRATRTGSQEGKASQSRSSARNCALRRDVRAHRACRLSRIAAGPLPTHLQTLGQQLDGFHHAPDQTLLALHRAMGPLRVPQRRQAKHCASKLVASHRTLDSRTGLRAGPAVTQYSSKRLSYETDPQSF